MRPMSGRPGWVGKKPEEAEKAPAEQKLLQMPEDYEAERDRAAYALIGMSMDRKLGRRPADLPGRRLVRRVLGDEFMKTDNNYDRFAH